MEDVKDNSHIKSGFDAEFQSLQMLDNLNVFSTDVGTRPENANKNRYRNVVPCKYLTLHYTYRHLLKSYQQT